jgi:hypothetical protein
LLADAASLAHLANWLRASGRLVDERLLAELIGQASVCRPPLAVLTKLERGSVALASTRLTGLGGALALYGVAVPCRRAIVDVGPTAAVIGAALDYAAVAAPKLSRRAAANRVANSAPFVAEIRSLATLLGDPGSQRVVASLELCAFAAKLTRLADRRKALCFL